MYHGPIYSSFFKKKKRVPHLSGAGGTNRRGEEGEGGLPSDPLLPSDFFLWSEPICFTLDRSTSLARLHACLFALSAVLLACLN